MNKLKLVLKILISLVFMWFAISKVDLDALGKVLVNANILFVVCSFFLFCFAMLVMVQRWNQLLRIFHHNIPFTDLVPVYWMGLFFSLFLPSAVGGDAVKMYKISKYHGKPVEVATSVLMDRVVGLTSLSILASASILIFRNSFDFNLAGKIIFSVAFSLLVFFTIIFNINIVKKLSFIRPLLRLVKLENILKKLYLSFHLYRSHLDSLIKSIAVSLTVNLMVVTSIFLLSRAVGMNISIVYFFVIMPIVFMITILPISISGLGLQEGAYVFFLGQVGVSPTLAFSMSLLAHSVRYLTGLIGGVFYMLERDRSRG